MIALFVAGAVVGAFTATSTILGLAYWHRRTLRREQRMMKAGRLALVMEVGRVTGMPKRLEVRA